MGTWLVMAGDMACQGWGHGSSGLGTWLVKAGDMACYKWGHGLLWVGTWLVRAGDMACYGWGHGLLWLGYASTIGDMSCHGPARDMSCYDWGHDLSWLSTCIVMTGDIAFKFTWLGTWLCNDLLACVMRFTVYQISSLHSQIRTNQFVHILRIE